MTIAITGATGFLGLRLVSLLLERGEQVVVLARTGTAPSLPRILRYLEGSSVTPDTARARMTVLSADVGRPRLGLPERQFRALAEHVTEIWHSAAATTLDESTTLVRRTNVDGTRHVLELAAAGTARLCHVSTAFVAGRRSAGVVREDDLDPSYGFENPYEESKYLAEVAVHEWSARHGRPVTIFRPSVLVTVRPPRPGDVPHTLTTLTTLAGYALGGLTERARVRVAADPHAHLNLMPVDLAARLMVDTAATAAPAGVRTVHVTHPREVGQATLFSLFEKLFPLRLEQVSTTPEDLTEQEAVVAQHMRVVMPYAFHRRYYDRTALRAAGLDPADAVPLGLDDLLAGLGRPIKAGARP
ncbi:SDR family oxidoreductase [Lentzea roselyniae]|uniref:SDR family oxidoreductase n=1 Tax=Lentzea roselyniae TaxID=531940 RepID=A0ABP7CDL6_9PSEU